MAAEGDVDEAIIGLANSLQSMLEEKQPAAHHVVLLPDVPGLLVRMFEFITSEVIRDDQQTNSARTLQTIFDTLAEIMGIPLNHITGVGLASLDRRQLYDALQVFNDLMKCFLVDEEQTARGKHRDDGKVLTLSQLESPRQHQRAQHAEYGMSSRETSTPKLSNKQFDVGLDTNAATDKSPSSIHKRNPPFYINQEGPNSARIGPSSTNKILTVNVNEEKHVTACATSTHAYQPKTNQTSDVNEDNRSVVSMASKRPPFVTGKPRVKSFSSRSQTRQPSVSSKKSEKSSRPPPHAQRANGDNYLRNTGEKGHHYVNAKHRKDQERNDNGRNKSTSSGARPLNGSPQGSVSSMRHDQYPFRSANAGRSNERRHISISSRRRGQSPLGTANTDRHKEGRRFVQSSRRGGQSPVGTANTDRYNEGRRIFVSSPTGEVFRVGRPRKPSVVSTKVKRHSITSPTDRTGVKRKVRRGELSPQTVSLCSSLKILEEFDYLKRRYKEIQTEIEQHMSKVRDLQAEEVRIEYVLNHVQHQLAFTKTKKQTKIEREIGLPV